jgi:hypothetical protein
MAQTRDFSHILIGDGVGPSITIGDTTVRFREKQALAAVVQLIDETTTTNALTRSKDYLRLSVLAEDAEALESVFDRITAEGLSEVVEWVAQAYTGFPTETSAA